MHHLLLYDGECGFCQFWVQKVLFWDTKEVFFFAPLQGKTAKKILQNTFDEYREKDSIVFIENFSFLQGSILGEKNIYMQSKAVFCIAWYLGFPWTLLGVLSFLPSWPFDWVYAIVAKNRRSFGKQRCMVLTKKQKERFLE